MAGGRTPKSAAGTLSKTLAFRLRPKMLEDLRAAAAVSGRSMSEEVEFRLHQSFSTPLTEERVRAIVLQEMARVKADVREVVVDTQRLAARDWLLLSDPQHSCATPS